MWITPWILGDNYVDYAKMRLVYEDRHVDYFLKKQEIFCFFIRKQYGLRF